MTECQTEYSLFNLTHKRVDVDFSGGKMTSDAGILLVAQADRKLELTKRIAELIPEWRSAALIHERQLLVQERIYLICAGYEDGNDASFMRTDGAFKIACGRNPESSFDLASQPSISRFENRVHGKSLLDQYELMLRVSLERKQRRHGGRLPKTLLFDLDSTCDPTHGQQPFSFYNAYYKTHMFHPLICTLDKDLVGVILRPGNVPAFAGITNWLEIAVRIVRSYRPDVRIILRADSGFCSPDFFDECDRLDLDYLVGMGYNSSLQKECDPLFKEAEQYVKKHGESTRLYKTTVYEAGRWDYPRAVVSMVEHTAEGKNIRHVVHNVGNLKGETVYKWYVQRGSMELNIKEFKNALNGDRLSCTDFEANAFRALLYGFAYVLMSEVRDAQEGTSLFIAQFDTLRLRVIKIAALVKESARRVHIQMASSFPLQTQWLNAIHTLSSG